MSGWLVDTRLFRHLSPGAGGRKPSFRDWVSGNTEPLYLSTMSLFVIETEIEKFRAHRQHGRAAEMDEWLGWLVAHYSHRIHPVDAEVARRAGALMRRSRDYPRGATFQNLLLAGTAQIHGHSLLTDAVNLFRPWAGIELWDPFDGRLPRKGGA